MGYGCLTSLGEISGGVGNSPPKPLLRLSCFASGSGWDVKVTKGLLPFLAALDCIPRMVDVDGGVGKPPKDLNAGGWLPQFRISFGMVSLADSPSTSPSAAVAYVAVLDTDSALLLLE